MLIMQSSINFSLIADNISSSGAGVYLRNSSVVDFTNVTITNNSAGLYGNAIYMRDGVELSLLNTVAWGNGCHKSTLDLRVLK